MNALQTQNNEINPQERFDKIYITATEICKTLGISRATLLYARKRGFLPEPISVSENRIYIWERQHTQRFIDAWRIVLNNKRGIIE